MAFKTAVRSVGIGVFLAGAILSATQWLDDKKPVEVEKNHTNVSKDSTSMTKSEVELLQKKITKLEAENKKLQQEPKTDTKKKPSVKQYTINVKVGMGTSEVSKLLEKEGIIKNSDDFEAYIINEGKSSSIQLGKTVVNEKMSNKELLNALTKRK